MSRARFLSLLACLLLAASAAFAQAPPRLVVFLIIDGLPVRQLTGYRGQFAPDGFARFLERGAVFTEARYGHAFTVTAAGHATLLTGASPAAHGIIGNEWRDPASGAVVNSVSDRPAHLRVETVGDVLRRVNPRSKVIAVAGKDRSAILPAGRAGTAYMYMAGSGQFASTAFYMQQPPAWVAAFHAAKPADRYFHAEWKPLLPEAAYAGSLPDGRLGPRAQLPMRMGGNGDKPDAAFYGSLLGSPFADALSLEFARAAIAGEQLGKDDVPDLLVVSLSGHDYVNHTWSAESRLSHDHTLQLDRLLQEFFRDLDADVGRNNYVAVLSTDHGFMPAVEWTLAQGRPAGRITGAAMLQRVNLELERKLGVPGLVRGTSASALVLDRALLAQRGLDRETVAGAARDALLAEPGIAAAYTRGELEQGSRAGAPHFAAMRRSWHRELSGDVQYAPRAHWMFGTAAATHGSPHDYDSHVPLLFWGPRWVKARSVAAPVDMVDVAPTLARLLQVAAPAASEGRPLPLLGP